MTTTAALCHHVWPIAWDDQEYGTSVKCQNCNTQREIDREGAFTYTSVMPSIDFGNTIAIEGCTRCACGSKYWESDICVDCGAHASLAPKEEEPPSLQDMADVLLKYDIVPVTDGFGGFEVMLACNEHPDQDPCLKELETNVLQVLHRVQKHEQEWHGTA